jgi:hypothetical protein
MIARLSFLLGNKEESLSIYPFSFVGITRVRVPISCQNLLYFCFRPHISLFPPCRKREDGEAHLLLPLGIVRRSS